jgi:uracil phosphoribosyltransferase
LLFFSHYFRSGLENISAVSNLLTLLIRENNATCSGFQEAATEITSFLTTTVIVASAEQSFSVGTEFQILIPTSSLKKNIIKNSQ